MCPGHIPFCSVLQTIYVGGACHGQYTPCQSGRMVWHRSCWGRRHGCRRKLEGSLLIFVEAAVGVRLVELIGTIGALGKVDAVPVGTPTK